MNKLSLISGALFIIADILAIISIFIPHWIISDVGGETRLGLIYSCFTLYKRKQFCQLADFQLEWTITLVLIIVGCLFITATFILLILSNWVVAVALYPQWLGFVAMLSFCLAAVIFPLGFTHIAIGGEAFQLPTSHQVGSSYILFVHSLWITVVSELFAGKVCIPHL